MKLAVALAAALLLAACGGGEKGPSAAEYIAGADRLCLRAQERVETLSDDFQNLDDVKLFATNAAKIGDALQTDLKALEVPEELRERVDEFNGVFANGLRLIRRLGKAAEDGDTDRIGQLGEEIDDQDKRLERVARSVGYKECGIPDEDEQDAAAAVSDPTLVDEDPPAQDGTGAGAGAEAASVGGLSRDEIIGLEDESVAFTAINDIASLEEDSDPRPVESASFEMDDEFEILEISERA